MASTEAGCAQHRSFTSCRGSDGPRCRFQTCMGRCERTQPTVPRAHNDNWPTPVRAEVLPQGRLRDQGCVFRAKESTSCRMAVMAAHSCAWVTSVSSRSRFIQRVQHVCCTNKKLAPPQYCTCCAASHHPKKLTCDVYRLSHCCMHKSVSPFEVQDMHAKGAVPLLVALHSLGFSTSPISRPGEHVGPEVLITLLSAHLRFAVAVTSASWNVSFTRGLIVN